MAICSASRLPVCASSVGSSRQFPIGGVSVFSTYRSHALLATELLCSLLISSPLQATSIPLRSLGEMARAAHLSFAGTVENVSYRMADNGRPVTDVTFKKISFARGQAKGQTLTLSLWGGRDRGDIVTLEGMPEFERGRRYVVLATD